MKDSKTHFLFLLLAFLSGVSVFAHRTALANETGVVNASVQLAICGDGIKNYGEQCDMGDLNGKACTGLGYDGGTLGCSIACEFDVTSCTTSATASAVSVLTPTADRTYVLPDGDDSLGIFLPQDFFANELSLFLFSHPATTTSPSGQSLVGKLYDLIFVSENGDIEHELNKASTITLSYADTDLRAVDESTLAPYRSEDSGASWIVVPDYIFDRAHKTITFTTINFSLFSIFGLPASPSGSGSGTGSGGASTGNFGNVVPQKATPEEKKQIIKIADFNGDGRVDISDMSIMLYYYGQTTSASARYDLTADGAVDIVDISVMLYYWEITL